MSRLAYRGVKPACGLPFYVGMWERKLEFDTTRAPVLVVRPTDSLTDAEMRAFKQHFRQVVANWGKSCAVVLDLRFHKDLPPTQRRLLTEDIQRGDANQLMCATAFVFDSKVTRMLLTAILWIATPPQELKVFHDLDEALIWAKMKVDGHRNVTRAV